jgi:ABC-2 type transport system ATP-binding protein
MSATIDARDVRLTYGETVALDGLSVSLHGPKIVGLIGRNGSGKSSLLSVLAALRKPDGGEVLVDGEPVYENASRANRIALIREGGDVVDEDEKVGEALRYAAWLRPNWDAGLADGLIERFRIPREKKLNALSRGQRSAVGIVLGLTGLDQGTPGPLIEMATRLDLDPGIPGTVVLAVLAVIVLAATAWLTARDVPLRNT